MGMIKRNAILINGGSAADVDRASTAAAAVGWSQSSRCRARGGAHPE